jgi:hypothetical protein
LKKHDLRAERRPLIQHFDRPPVDAADEISFRPQALASRGAPTEHPGQTLIGAAVLPTPYMARQDASSPMASYDIGWIWQELGLETLRR